MKNKLIWEKLIIDGKRYTTSQEMESLSNKLGNGYPRSLKYLQEHEYIFRIFRGIFYVKDADEKERGYFKDSVYKMIATGLKMKGVGNWYFGLQTALKMNLMTHEYFTLDFVITDSYRTTKIIKILDMKFQFYRWSKDHFKEGILKQQEIRYSDKERTVLDLIYRRYIDRWPKEHMLAPILDYEDRIDQDKVRQYIHIYPKKMGEMVLGSL